MATQIITRDGTEIIIKVVKVASGYQTQSHLKSLSGQTGTLYGKVYKTQKWAERQYHEWVDAQWTGLPRK